VFLFLVFFLSPGAATISRRIVSVFFLKHEVPSWLWLLLQSLSVPGGTIFFCQLHYHPAQHHEVLGAYVPSGKMYFFKDLISEHMRPLEDDTKVSVFLKYEEVLY
jgi:hypothetical protein